MWATRLQMGEVAADFKVLSNIARRVGLSVVLWAWPHSRAPVGGLAMWVELHSTLGQLLPLPQGYVVTV